MKNSLNKDKTKYFFRTKSGILVMALLLLCAVFLGCMFGSTSLSLKDIWDGLLLKGSAKNPSIILYYIRIPRVAAALLAGIGLSVSGVLLQCVTGNEMAAPNIIGVNAGAGFSCILLLTFLPYAFWALPLASFLGAFLTTLLIVTVSDRIGASRKTVILVGIAFTAVLNAGISFLSLMDTDVLSSYNAFSVGGLDGIPLSQLIIPGIIIAFCLILSLILSGQINLLALGDRLASSLGVKVKALRIVCLICASASAAAVVSFAGLLGFVGLVVPHIARRFVGISVRPLLIASSFIGAILVILSDLLGRVILAPSEVPVGIIMAVIGAPFFFILLLKRRGIDAEM